jgi:hypothetical protein
VSYAACSNCRADSQRRFACLGEDWGYGQGEVVCWRACGCGWPA